MIPDDFDLSIGEGAVFIRCDGGQGLFIEAQRVGFSISILDRYGGNLLDYWAILFAMAIQSFFIPDLQSGVARGILRALAQSIRAK